MSANVPRTILRLVAAITVGLLVATLGAGDASARRKRKAPRAAATPSTALREPTAAPAPDAPAEAMVPGRPVNKTPKGPKVMDFTGLDVEGKLRTPQLLYFLGRAQQELDRASLERRSFMPELSRSLDEGGF